MKLNYCAMMDSKFLKEIRSKDPSFRILYVNK